MKSKIIAILLCFAFLCCSDDDSEIDNLIEESGLIGDWEVSRRGIDNIAEVDPCCESIIFFDDDIITDNRGNYTYTFGVITNGIFILNSQENEIIITTENNNTYTRSYNLINTNSLELSYTENGSQFWTIYSKSEN